MTAGSNSLQNIVEIAKKNHRKMWRHSLLWPGKGTRLLGQCLMQQRRK